MKLLTAAILGTVLMAGAAHAGCERNGVLLNCNGHIGTVTPNGNVNMLDGRHGQLLDQSDFTNGWRSNQAPMAIITPQQNTNRFIDMDDDD